jgi:5-methyltetrahydrofolate--homocysteine methyltransferase
MADYARLAVDLGARIVGGCCGTTPEHVRAMRTALDQHERGPAPDVATIVAKLGEISTGAQTQAEQGPTSELPQGEAASVGGRRRRGRRRAAG